MAGIGVVLEPARVRPEAAAAGREGTVLATADEWAALLPARRAAASGMREQQRSLLPADVWATVEQLVEESQEAPPRRSVPAKPPVPRSGTEPKDEV